jgi:hypothetical protein
MSSALIHLSITHSGRSLTLSLDPSSFVSELVATLSQEFSVLPSTCKLLSKGKKLDLSDPSSRLDQVLSKVGLDPSSTSSEKPLKLLLIGPRSGDLEALRENERLRDKKRQAFEHHQSISHLAKPTPASSSRIRTIGGEDDAANYRFHVLEPFPKEHVPIYEKRLAMLERLAKDEAVLDVMKRHKFAVGVL